MVFSAPVRREVPSSDPPAASRWRKFRRCMSCAPWLGAILILLWRMLQPVIQPPIRELAPFERKAMPTFVADEADALARPVQFIHRQRGADEVPALRAIDAGLVWRAVVAAA